ncbi:hypothetical protein [Faecalispora anaeroviscerum]|uniref:hypothetical protein n=1 Tax=Faecalispora anaeroviscerum TaxID=2991836 RepID=UPI0024BB01A0|nr:hypothetical protein [Faecalispora anaeroviscerum]
MNKTKSKVLSLILASAMIVSSFSSLNFASAASTRETGSLTGIQNLNDDDELFLVSGSSAKTVSLATLIGNPSIETYDHENAGAADYDSYNHVSGDKLITINKDGDLTLKKDASGKEVITVTYEVEDYDRDDKEVTVKASKEITIYSDKENELFLGKPTTGTAVIDEKPDDIKTAAVNQMYLDVQAYYAVPESGSTIVADYKRADATATGISGGITGTYLTTAANYALQPLTNVVVALTATAPTGTPTALNAKSYAAKAVLPALTASDSYYAYDGAAWNKLTASTEYASNIQLIDTSKLEMKGDKIFDKVAIAGASEFVKQANGNYTVQNVDSTLTDTSIVRLFTTFEVEVSASASGVTPVVPHKDAELAKTGNDTLKIKLGDFVPAVTTPTTVAAHFDIDSSVTNQKVEVAKKWDADIDLLTGSKLTGSNLPSKWEINKKNGKTYIAAGGFDWDDKDYWKTNKDNADAVGSYDEIVSDTSIKLLGGSVELLNVGSDSNPQSVTVEDGTVGDIKATTVDIQGGTVGTVKDRARTITISEGKVKAIDAEDASANITGGDITGNVVVSSLTLDAEDDDVDTTIGGNVTVKNKTVANSGVSVDSSSDATVTVKGTLKSEDQGGEIKISGDNVSLNVVDGDYINDVSFDDFTGAIKGIAAATEQTVKLENESKVVLTSKLIADSVDVDEDSRLEVSDARIGSIDGDGRFAFPADKLFVEDGVSDEVKMELTAGLTAGATAFQSNEGAVDGADIDGLGFGLETKSVNKTTDKQVIKNVTFAGPKFDKTDLTIAKGQSTTVTVANYPDGTALPSGASIAYDVDANDDYVSVTQEGNVLTIKALDYNADRSIDNKATVTASVVDANGDELEDYAEATLNVNVVEKPQSTVTLDTTKPVTLGTGAVYQYIAKSSTAAVMTATSSDTQVATVELFNAADPRGYKFQVKGVAVGTATITTTDANGATATLTVNVAKVNGTLKADTTSYTFAPGKAYDVKFSTTGTTAVPVVTVNGKVVSIAPRGNGVYRVTAQNAGTAFVVATVGNTHVSVKFVVAKGAASVGVKGNNVSALK